MSNYNNQPQKKEYQEIENELIDISIDQPKYDLSKGNAILKSINAVHSKIIENGGVGKSRVFTMNKNNYQNNQQKNPNDYNYRSIDDIYNAISGLLSEENIICLPNIINVTISKILSRNNDLMFKVTAVVRYTLLSSIDGSYVETTSVGESNDSADKGATKASSIAHKNMLTQMFSIPSNENNQQNHQQNHQKNSNQYSYNNGRYEQNQRPQANQQKRTSMSNNLATLEFKNSVDELMRKHNYKLIDVANKKKLDLNTITYGELLKLKTDFEKVFPRK